MAMPQLHKGAAEVVRISVGSGSNKVKFARALVLRTEFFISNNSNIKPNIYLWQSG